MSSQPNIHLWEPEVHKILLNRKIVANQDPERPMEANIRQ